MNSSPADRTGAPRTPKAAALALAFALPTAAWTDAA